MSTLMKLYASSSRMEERLRKRPSATPQALPADDSFSISAAPGLALLAHDFRSVRVMPQAKLKVGRADDPAEAEADQMAEVVMSMAAPESQAALETDAPVAARTVHRLLDPSDGTDDTTPAPAAETASIWTSSAAIAGMPFGSFAFAPGSPPTATPSPVPSASSLPVSGFPGSPKATPVPAPPVPKTFTGSDKHGNTVSISNHSMKDGQIADEIFLSDDAMEMAIEPLVKSEEIIPYPYLDLVAKITIGVGHLVGNDNLEDFKRLGLVNTYGQEIKDPDYLKEQYQKLLNEVPDQMQRMAKHKELQSKIKALKATINPDEIKALRSDVEALQAQNIHPASHFENKTDVRLPHNQVASVFQADVEVHAKRAGSRLKKSVFTTLPSGAQAALFDIAFNHGSIPEELAHAVHNADWKAAAEETRDSKHLEKMDPKRRKADAKLFESIPASSSASMAPPSHDGTARKKSFASDVAGQDAPDSVHHVIASGGTPLDSEARAFLEPRFGHDFRAVRVHADQAAADLRRRSTPAPTRSGRTWCSARASTRLTQVPAAGCWRMSCPTSSSRAAQPPSRRKPSFKTMREQPAMRRSQAGQSIKRRPSPKQRPPRRKTPTRNHRRH